MTLPLYKTKKEAAHRHGQVRNAASLLRILERLWGRKSWAGAVTLIIILLLAVAYYLWKYSGGQTTNTTSSPPPPPRRRIPQPDASSARLALLLPFVGGGGGSSSSSSSSAAGHIVPYLPLFCRAAAGLQQVDIFLLHDGILETWPLVQEACGGVVPNPRVRLVHLGSTRALAERLLSRLLPADRITALQATSADQPPTFLNLDDDALAQAPELLDNWNYERLLTVLTSFLHVNPYGLVEFKPALGHLFQEEIQNYTHWGYADLDLLWGDVDTWWTADERFEYDVVTWTFGDQSRLYVRGQFSVFRNDPLRINQLWRNCSYLSRLDRRFAQIMAQQASYSTESAEGCFSQVLLRQKDLNMKYVTKAWTDIDPDDTANTHGVYWSRHPRTGRQVLYKAVRPAAGHNSSVRWMPPPWEGWRHPWHPVVPPTPLGERQPLPLPTEQDNGQAHCMYWVHSRYQPEICLPTSVAAHETVLYLQGQLYKQAYQETPRSLTLGVETRPFFHFQEWKRHYRFGQLATAMTAASWEHFTSFLLTSAGAIPLISGTIGSPSRKSSWAPAPLAQYHPDTWPAVAQGRRDQLPGHVYCIVSGVDWTGRRFSCTTSLLWTDPNTTELLSTAPAWSQSVQVQTDVTLVLTWQITAAQSQDESILRPMLQQVVDQIQRWQEKPCVLVIFVAGATPESAALLREQLATGYDHALIAVIYDASEDVISRKALLNMAMDAVPTRWYLIGLELERGLILSLDTVYLAHRATSAALGQQQGQVWWVPQFGLAEDELHADLTLSALAEAERDGRIQPLYQYEETCEGDEEEERWSVLDVTWWKETTEMLTTSPKNSTSKYMKAMARQQAEKMQELENELLSMLSDQYESQLLKGDLSPILLVDNIGPYDGLRTNELAREVEEFAGLRCYNGLKVAQLAALGYHLGVLSGAFAVSSTQTRSLMLDHVNRSQYGQSRCHGCFMLNNDEAQQRIIDIILRQEKERVAQAAIVWSEIVMEKP